MLRERALFPLPLPRPHARRGPEPLVRAKDLDRLLLERFGHEGFREGQREVVEALLQGEHALVVRPTGSGKSLCYQLTALGLPGVTVVVSPLISLMQDQVKKLTALGIPAAAVHSGLERGERALAFDQLAAGTARVLYVSPERFRNARFAERLARLEVSLLAVDEAHCVSEWGHDFRPEYRRLARARAALGDPTTVALTATATERVQLDILRQLDLEEATVFVSGFERPNLFFEVIAARRAEEKLAYTRRLVRALDDGAGLIYCQTRREAEAVCARLGAEAAGVGLYHAGLDDDERRRVQERFMSGALPVLCATAAFGMGIDRPDIRFVVHHGVPRSLEAYYQQCGRAGRDGRPARCVLLHSRADRWIHDFFIDRGTPDLEAVRQVWQAMSPEDGVGARGFGVRELAARLATPAGPRGGRGGARLAIEGALRLLADAEIVRVNPGGALEVLRVDAPKDTLGIDWPSVLTVKEAERGRLETMLEYATPGRCRSRAILRYFHDPEAALDHACGHCDVCAKDLELPGLVTPAHGDDPQGGALPRPLGDDVPTTVKKVLSCVARMGGAARRRDAALCLTGSRSTRSIEAGLPQISTFGLLSTLRQQDVLDWIDRLSATGLLRQSRGGRVYLTRPGVDVMAGRAPVPPGIDGARA